MIPVVTPDEMAAIDAAATDPVDVLIERAGAAVALHATALMGGTYGRDVTVIAGPGNNGNDGRVAARRLARRGARITLVDAARLPSRLPECDLVIDAAYGTGLKRPFTPPEFDGEPLVLAVDIPSGVSGMTGEVLGGALSAALTVTFAALKPGLLFPPGRALSGEVVVADIGLDVSRARMHVVEATDIARLVPPRPVDTHKWRRATWVIGGSPGMTGAPQLAALAAARAGAGYVRLSVPGQPPGGNLTPIEAVVVPLGSDLCIAANELARVQSAVIGPGLGRGQFVSSAVARFVAEAGVPLVVDGDALVALGTRGASIVSRRTHPTVLTPHDGEYQSLTGSPPGPDRIDAARRLARESRAVVVLKGPTMLVADPEGNVAIALAGDARLATAGTGDVLSGVIGALLAQGADPLAAAAAGAHLLGAAAATCSQYGTVAGDVARALPVVLSRLRGGSA